MITLNDASTYKISDYLMFKEEDLKGTEYGGEIDFPNGYGLSIVKHQGSYGGTMGLYEIMLTGANHEPIEYTEITYPNDTVQGYLTVENVNDIINKVAGLPQI